MCEIEHVFGMVASHWQLVNADVDDDQRWLCVHLCYKHTERNITLMDITSKRNVQGTDIISNRNVEGTDTQNQFTKQVFIKPVYSTCIYTEYARVEPKQQ